jgi:hypothetical protein
MLVIMLPIAFVSILSCNFVELVFYVHEPTQNFHENFDFEDEKIKEFIKDDIFFFPDIWSSTHTDNLVRIGLYALLKAKEVKICKATISNPSGTYEKEIKLYKKYKLDRNEYSKNIYNKTITLFNIDDFTLEKLTENNIAVLNVSYETNKKTINSISFKMERKVEKYLRSISQ